MTKSAGKKKVWRAMMLVRFMADFTDRYKVHPSLRQMQDGIGIKSSSHVSEIVHYLVDNGYAMQPFGPVPRGTVLTQKGEIAARQWRDGEKESDGHL